MSGAMYPSSRHDRPHGRIYDHHTAHPAWIGLSPAAFKILSVLFAKYRPNETNCFQVGERRIAELAGISPSAARKSINELIDKGHLNIERKGRNQGELRTRERMVSLTRFDSETAAGDPDLPIKIWKQANASN